MSKNKGGRPSIYGKRIEPFLKQIAVLREKGIAHEDIAKMLGIAPSTYYKHKAEIDKFSERIKNGDEELVNTGKMSLGKLVSGYERKIITHEYRYDSKGNKKLFKTRERIEEIGPEQTSVFFALVNKSNGEFKHRQEVEFKDADGTILTFAETMRRQYEERLLLEEAN